MATAIVVPLQPLPYEDVVLPPELKDMRLVEWDYGLFEQEIQRLGIVTKQGEVNDTVIKKGTFNGTTKALTEMFRRVEKRHGSYFDVMNFEPTTPQNFSLAKKRELYTWAAPDSYPPHLAIIPLGDKYEDKLIFDEVRLADTQNLLGAVIPDTLIDFIDHGNPSDGGSIAALELTNRTMRAEKKDVMEDPNIGDRDDWFSDALFAQSQLTGPNPMTLKQASKDWIKRFILTAKERKNSDMESFLISLEPESLYIQDNSYVRDAVGAAGDDVLKSDYGPNGIRFACCSVTLFHLDDAGTLHPLAIVLDYKRAMKFSVVKFNKFLRPVQAAPTAAAQAKQLAAEKVDWPWRYAKLCAQVSDWVTHNLQIHLVNTHLVEEAVIVATQRSFENDHPVYRLLQPHWIKTLSLNASARASLVPGVVTPIVGLTPTQVQAYVKDAYYRFDWQGQYVPKDLETRGFPVQKLYTDKKYHNYAYAKNIYLMWQTLHKFVSSALRIRYKNNGDVQADQWIKNWSTEMRSDIGGRMKSFPIIKDFAQLVDAVVMSIHIASPQHNAVNYLQAFYGSFVINKPPCLCKEVISSYDALDAVKEADLLAALPVGKDHGPLWLLASHLPYLLSYRVADDQTLMNYAFSLWKLSLDLKPPNPTLVSIASEFYTTLRLSVLKFGKHNTDLDEHLIPYTVMDPSTTAISILI